MNDHAPTYTQHQLDAAYERGWHDGHESAATQRAALQHEAWQAGYQIATGMALARLRPIQARLDALLLAAPDLTLDRLEAVEARLAELEAGRRGQREAT